MEELLVIQRKLRAPFHPSDIEWRISRCGAKDGQPWAQVLAYITSRAVMDRLDSVFGIDGWNDEYTKGPDGGILCSLSVLINNEWITKQDAAENTNIDSIKGGISGALKRAAVKFGIGRYLYHLTENFADIKEDGLYYQKGKQGEYKGFKWSPKPLPDFALPASSKAIKALEDYLDAYEAKGDDSAVKAISEALVSGSVYSVNHMIEYIERKAQ